MEACQAVLEIVLDEISISVLLPTLSEAVISTVTVSSVLAPSQTVPDMTDREAISWDASAVCGDDPALASSGPY